MVVLDNLTLGYDRHPAVHHLNVTIEKGSLVAIAGPNGAGKSTLLKGIMGELHPMEGSISCVGIEKTKIAYLPQQSQVDKTFPITVKELVGMGNWNTIGAFGRIRSNHTKKVTAALKTVGLEGFEKRLIGTLSGGQMQRALFARLLIQEADLILLDEPFSAVDQGTSVDLLSLIHRWSDEGKTIIAVLHDSAQIRDYFPLTLLLSRQCIAYGPTKEVMTDENLSAAKRLREAFDENAELCHSHEHSH